MKQVVSIWAGIALASSVAVGQQADSLLYHEPTDDGNYRFYFDDRYFLADRDCEFVSIERDGGYNRENKTWDGPFADYTPTGRPLMTGHYTDGKKQGQFQAFHNSGALKWQGAFENDMPKGEWEFFYPDGLRLCVVEYRADGLYLRDYWDQRGRQVVESGKGRYEVTIKLDGYQEHGYEFVRRRGRVVDGKPHGPWAHHYLLDGKVAADAGFEQFAKGVLVRGYDSYVDEWYSDSSRLPLLPIEPFVRAELFVGKACSIDAYTDFLSYLQKHVEAYFEGYEDEVEVQTIEYVIELNRDGTSRTIRPVRTFPRKSLENELTWAFQVVPFWFPSYVGDEYVADTLTVTASVFPDIKGRRLRFFDMAITRKKGF